MKGILVKDIKNVFDNVVIVKKEIKALDEIEKHNHPGHDVHFNVVKGKIDITLNDDEKYSLESGDILRFNGENYISAKITEDLLAYVYLIRC